MQETGVLSTTGQGQAEGDWYQNHGGEGKPGDKAPGGGDNS